MTEHRAVLVPDNKLEGVTLAQAGAILWVVILIAVIP
jgi:hypothetical protein